MSSKITQQNAKFLSNLKGDECIRVDDKGKLYAVEGIVGNLFYRYVSSAYLQNIDKAIKEGLEESFQSRKIQGVKSTGSSALKKYQNAFSALEQSKVLSPSNTKLLVNNYYEKRYEILQKTKHSPFVCEAIVTMEMCHDPHVSDSDKQKIKPQLAKTGVNGTYFVKNRKGEIVGVFKPWDEEAEMPNNPKEREGEYDPSNPGRHPAYPGHIKGTAWKKEVAASVIDKEGIAGVPETVKITVPFLQKIGEAQIVLKHGSLQKFEEGVAFEELDRDEIEKIPDREIHKIVALDLLIGMGDRNLGNFLWNGKQVVPIDHGFSFFDGLEWGGEETVRSDMNCMWYSFPQVERPIDKDICDWVLKLDIPRVTRDLREQSELPEGSIREFMIRMMIFQKGLEKGLNLKEIAGNLMAIKMGCLVEVACNQAIKDCEKLSSQWKKLPKLQKEHKRFEIYFKLVQTIVEKELSKGV